MIIFYSLLCAIFAGVLPGLGVAFYILRDTDKYNALDRLLLALIVSPILLVTLSFLEAAAGLVLSNHLLIINLIALNTASVYALSRLKPDFNIKSLLSKLTLLQICVYLGIFIIFTARILSVIKLHTPLLHDPIAHAEWLKILTDTGRTTTQSWYPQGLEYYLQYFTSLGGLQPAKMMLLGTNVFLSLIPVGLYYAVRLIKDDDGLFPVSALVISSVLAMPNYFFFTAGKNSMIMAFALVPIALYYVYKTTQGEYNNIIFALFAFAIFIIHYPTGVFVYLLWGLNFIWSNLVSLKNIRKNFVKSLSFMIPTFSLLALAAVKVYPLYIAFPASDDKSVSGIISYIQTVGLKQFVLNDFLSYQISVFGFFLVMTLIGSTFLYILTLTQRRPAGDTLARMVVGFTVLYACLSVLLKLPQKTLGIFINIEVKFFTFFILIFLVSWLIQYLVTFLEEDYHIKVSMVAYLLLAALLIHGNAMVFNKFREAGKNLSTVTAADIKAFEYISGNLTSSDRVLVQMARGNGVVMPTDGGAWISTYTNTPIDVDFSNFSKPVSEKIFEQYQGIGTNSQALTNLYCDYNIRYIYFGSRPVFAPGTDKRVLEDTGQVTIEYNHVAVLYKVSPQDCSQ